MIGKYKHSDILDIFIQLTLVIFGFYGFIIFQDLPIKYLYYTKSILISLPLFWGGFHPSYLQGLAPATVTQAKGHTDLSRGRPQNNNKQENNPEEERN